MNRESEYIAAAWEEITTPTFELTKQYLSAFKVKTENGSPIVARVNLYHHENIVAVYFTSEEEYYFLVINLTKEPEIKIDGVWVESGHRVYLTATSETLNFQQLSAFLKLKPLTGWSKGDLRQTGKSYHTFSRIAFEPNTNIAYDLDEKLAELLIELE